VRGVGGEGGVVPVQPRLSHRNLALEVDSGEEALGFCLVVVVLLPKVHVLSEVLLAVSAGPELVGLSVSGDFVEALCELLVELQGVVLVHFESPFFVWPIKW